MVLVNNDDKWLKPIILRTNLNEIQTLLVCLGALSKTDFKKQCISYYHGIDENIAEKLGNNISCLFAELQEIVKIEGGYTCE